MQVVEGAIVDVSGTVDSEVVFLAQLGANSTNYSRCEPPSNFDACEPHSSASRSS